MVTIVPHGCQAALTEAAFGAPVVATAETVQMGTSAYAPASWTLMVRAETLGLTSNDPSLPTTRNSSTGYPLQQFLLLLGKLGLATRGTPRNGASENAFEPGDELGIGKRPSASFRIPDARKRGVVAGMNLRQERGKVRDA